MKDFSSSFQEKERKERKYLHIEQNVRSVEITHTHSHTRLKERGVEESKRVTKFFFKSFSKEHLKEVVHLWIEEHGHIGVSKA